MKRFVLFAIALIAIAVVLQALVQPRAMNGGRVTRFQFKARPPISAATTVPPSHAASPLPSSGGH